MDEEDEANNDNRKEKKKTFAFLSESGGAVFLFFCFVAFVSSHCFTIPSIYFNKDDRIKCVRQ